MEINDYDFSTLNNIMAVKVRGKRVWEKRVNNQITLLQLIAPQFAIDIGEKVYSFRPGTIYFATPLTADPEYTKRMKPTWKEIKELILESGWDEVYAPFELTDPYSTTPDGLTPMKLSEIDHIQVLLREVGLFDFNQASSGAGQEVELALSALSPRIGFSKNNVSRMTRGTPGTVILKYEDRADLKSLIKDVFARRHYSEDPFYVDRCEKHPIHSVFRGEVCLRCEFGKYLWGID